MGLILKSAEVLELAGTLPGEKVWGELTGGRLLEFSREVLREVYSLLEISLVLSLCYPPETTPGGALSEPEKNLETLPPKR